jgi:hypothetical protein
MKLPAPIQAYFDADKGAADAAPIGAFASDAVVEDEGRTHAGPAAIEAWWRASKAQYQATAEPFDIRDEQDRTIVRAKVTGAFPGSPVALTFAFHLVNGRIAALRIGA